VSVTNFDADRDAPKWAACPVCGHWKRPKKACEHCLLLALSRVKRPKQKCNGEKR
jgi:ribosomal protein L32